MRETHRHQVRKLAEQQHTVTKGAQLVQHTVQHLEFARDAPQVDVVNYRPAVAEVVGETLLHRLEDVWVVAELAQLHKGVLQGLRAGRIGAKVCLLAGEQHAVLLHVVVQRALRGRHLTLEHVLDLHKCIVSVCVFVYVFVCVWLGGYCGYGREIKRESFM